MSDDLCGPRLVLERLRADHAERLFEGLSAPELYAYIPVEPPASVDALRARFSRIEGGLSPNGRERWLNWAARHKDGTYAGLFEATVYETGRASIAYFIFPHSSRRGYGVEGVGLVLQHLVGVLGVSVVEARIDTRNVASQRLVERVGFARVGHIAGADRFKGATSDEFVYAWLQVDVETGVFERARRGEA